MNINYEDQKKSLLEILSKKKIDWIEINSQSGKIEIDIDKTSLNILSFLNNQVRIFY